MEQVLPNNGGLKGKRIAEGHMDKVLSSFLGGEGVGEALERRGRPRGREEGEEWSLQQLRGYHRQILVLHVMGLKNYEIASRLNITPQTVSNTINADISKPILSELFERLNSPVAEVSVILSENMPDMVRDLVREFFTPGTDLKDKARIGFGLMDRGGYGPTKTVIKEDRMDKRVLQEVLKRAADSGFVVPSERIEDATIIEEDNQDV